jgi:hypothetical protein
MPYPCALRSSIHASDEDGEHSSNASLAELQKPLDSRFRGDDDIGEQPRFSLKVAYRSGAFAAAFDYEMLARNVPASRGNATDPNRISR